MCCRSREIEVCLAPVACALRRSADENSFASLRQDWSPVAHLGSYEEKNTSTEPHFFNLVYEEYVYEFMRKEVDETDVSLSSLDLGLHRSCPFRTEAVSSVSGGSVEGTRTISVPPGIHSSS